MPADNVLRIGAEFDVAPLMAANQQAVMSFDQFKVRLMEFSAAADKAGLAAEAQAARILALGMSSDATKVAIDAVGMSTQRAEVLTHALTSVLYGETAAFEGLAAAAATANAEVEATSAVTITAGQKAGAAIGALSGNVGRTERMLGTLAARSELLGPIMTAAFPVFAAIAVVEIIGRVSEGIHKMSNELMGYTEEVQKAEKENIKWSEKNEESVHTIAEGHEKIAANLRIIEQQEEVTWGDKAMKGAEAANEQRSAWLNLLPGLGDVVTAYKEISGAIKGVEEGANAESKAVQQNILHMQQIVKLQGEQLGEEMKLRQGAEASQKIGETRVKQAQDHVAALQDEQRIAEAQAYNKAMQGGGDVMRNAAMSQLNVRNEYAQKIEEATKQLGQAELTASIDRAKATSEAEKTVGLARVAQREAFAKQEYEMVKASEVLTADIQREALAKEITELEKGEEEKYNIERKALEAKKSELGAQGRTGKDTSGELITLNAQLIALSVKHETEMSALHAKGVAEREAIDKKEDDRKEKEAEEISKRTQVMAEKDQEQYESDLIRRTRLTEEQIKQEADQHKTQSDNAEKIREAGVFKASGTEQIRAATAALQDEETALAKIISLEEELQAKLAATNDPKAQQKIAESLQHEQGVIGQLNVVWGRYEAVVTKVAIDQEKRFADSYKKITGYFNSSIGEWMRGNETFGQAMIHMWQSMAQTAVQSLLQIGEGMALAAIQHKQMSEVTQLQNAKDSASGAWTSVMNMELPVPLNFILGAAAASLAFAGAIFERGGIMPEGHMAAAIRPEEMVLPANISRGIQGAIPSIQNFNTMMQAGSPAMAGSSTSNKTMHNHISVNVAQTSSGGIDHGAIIAAVKRGIRTGALGF